MAEDSGQERTEQATPRRREQARKEGRVAFSSDLNGSVLLLLGVVLMWVIGPRIVGALRRILLLTLAYPQRDMNIDGALSLAGCASCSS